MLWLATAWPYAILAICFLAVGVVFRAQHGSSPDTDPLMLWRSLGAPAKVGVMLAYLATISLPQGFATAGAVMVVWGDLRGEPVDAGSVARRFREIYLRLIVLSFIIGTICVFGGMFFLAPGLLGFAFLSFAIPLLVIENASVGRALRKGLDLASKVTGTLLGLYAIVLVVVLAVVVIAFVVGDSMFSTLTVPWWLTPIAFWGMVGLTASSLIMGTTAVVVTLYWDLCQPAGETAAAGQPA